MKKTLLTILVCLFSAVIANAQAINPNEKPLFTLACLSDIHTERGLITDINNLGLRGSFELTVKRISEEEEIDALIFGGDCTSDATIPLANWQKVRQNIAAKAREAFTTDKTPVIYVTGNHDYEVANWDNIPKPYNAADYYSYPMKQDIGELSPDDSFYEDADNGSSGTMSLLAAYHYVINGFDFVILNCGKYEFKSAWDYRYSLEAVQWVDKKLDEIYAEDPDKTVFFALHIPFGDSNSIREVSKGMVKDDAEATLKAALSKHPNLIMLYGHDHGGDRSYTREKTSQRVTHYDKSGNVIATYDANHVDGVTSNDLNDPAYIGPSTWVVKNVSNGRYLGFDEYNLATVETPNLSKFSLVDPQNWGYSVSVTGSGSEANGNYIYSSTDGHYSANAGYKNSYIYEVTQQNAEGIVAHKVQTLENGKTYIIATVNAKDASKLYALTGDGVTGKHRLAGLLVNPDANGTITLEASQTAALWTISPEEKFEPVYIMSFDGRYLGFDDYNLAAIDTPNTTQIKLIDSSNWGYSLSVNGSGSEISGNYIYSSTDGHYSGNGSYKNSYFYEVTQQNAEDIVAHKVQKPEEGKTYLIVTVNAKDASKLYALTSDGVAGKHRLAGLYVEDVEGTVTIDASKTVALWTISAEVPQLPWYVISADGRYLGFDSYNLAAIATPNTTEINLIDADKWGYSLKVDGTASEISGNYIYSSTDGHYSGNGSYKNSYFYEVTQRNGEAIVANKVEQPEEGKTYLIVTVNAKDASKLYALTSDGVSGKHRLAGLFVEDVDGVITLDASKTVALWTLSHEAAADVTPAEDASFFSAFMGSMRYYNNTIDPGDMPVGTPNIVQALMIYVYKDRVELHMKNYNKYGNISGITVMKNLVPYISYRKVNEVATGIKGMQVKDSYVERHQVYDLQGRKVGSRLNKGLYVTENGRKILVK